MHAELQRRQPRQAQPQAQPQHLTRETISEEPDGLAVATAGSSAGNIMVCIEKRPVFTQPHFGSQ